MLDPALARYSMLLAQEEMKWIIWPIKVHGLSSLTGNRKGDRAESGGESTSSASAGLWSLLMLLSSSRSVTHSPSHHVVEKPEFFPLTS